MTKVMTLVKCGLKCIPGGTAPVGVVGFEMLYDSFAKTIIENAWPCGPRGIEDVRVIFVHET